ncbi:hypothetical protein TRFO_26354 [Tritrichomonas foetus]|uniref:Uncharacterized protein n=1 Tax=Tritrichomonas foetus TaxID=1144522 RepID=A0A1J4K391_9EUKA|nr:hypothetical protein TRFO_26354 [Tritrichomonas foetus]|eukprot:OHT05839.1 hypothetical protein TRFO_26354 [Tritrichomonas foetus]
MKSLTLYLKKMKISENVNFMIGTTIFCRIQTPHQYIFLDSRHFSLQTSVPISQKFHFSHSDSLNLLLAVFIKKPDDSYFPFSGNRIDLRILDTTPSAYQKLPLYSYFDGAEIGYIRLFISNSEDFNPNDLQFETSSEGEFIVPQEEEEIVEVNNINEFPVCEDEEILAEEEETPANGEEDNINGEEEEIIDENIHDENEEEEEFILEETNEIDENGNPKVRRVRNPAKFVPANDPNYKVKINPSKKRKFRKSLSGKKRDIVVKRVGGKTFADITNLRKNESLNKLFDKANLDPEKQEKLSKFLSVFDRNNKIYNAAKAEGKMMKNVLTKPLGAVTLHRIEEAIESTKKLIEEAKKLPVSGKTSPRPPSRSSKGSRPGSRASNGSQRT